MKKVLSCLLNKALHFSSVENILFVMKFNALKKPYFFLASMLTWLTSPNVTGLQDLVIVRYLLLILFLKGHNPKFWTDTRMN